MDLICGIGVGTSITEMLRIINGGHTKHGNTIERLVGNKKPL